MAPKNKGKKKIEQHRKPPTATAPDAPGPPDLSLPPPVQQAPSSPEPKPIRLIPRDITNASQFPNASQQDVLSSETQVGDDWAGQGQIGTWGAADPDPAPDNTWGGDDYADEGEEGEGGEAWSFRSGEHASPSAGIPAGSPGHSGQKRDALPGGWTDHSPGTNTLLNPPQGMSPRNTSPQGGHAPTHLNPQVLFSALTGLAGGHGGHPEPPVSGAEPVMKRRNTLKKHAHPAPEPPDHPSVPAPAPPAKSQKHVAFGSSLSAFLHPSAGQRHEAVGSSLSAFLHPSSNQRHEATSSLSAFLHPSMGQKHEAPAPPPPPATATPGLLSTRHMQPRGPQQNGWGAADMLPGGFPGVPGQPSPQTQWGMNAAQPPQNISPVAAPLQ
ncbi:hypothetical protein NM688_g8161 [Phlebia brevispora]|uniref:Uncharacterized protein n=1 Tax=Phlebia brevispora TaxID=194682 RepID=A0ACC1RWH7_9APHY|nr:hypothetical protein NM688_g8161 [Phlebia brevispora]